MSDSDDSSRCLKSGVTLIDKEANANNPGPPHAPYIVKITEPKHNWQVSFRNSWPVYDSITVEDIFMCGFEYHLACFRGTLLDMPPDQRPDRCIRNPVGYEGLFSSHPDHVPRFDRNDVTRINIRPLYVWSLSRVVCALLLPFPLLVPHTTCVW